MFTYGRNKIFLIFLIAVAMCSRNVVLSRPSTTVGPVRSVADVEQDKEDNAEIDTSKYHRELTIETIIQIQKCEEDPDAMELCMRCAKVTKSNIVYPMCCANEDEVKVWCYDYVFYGVQN